MPKQKSSARRWFVRSPFAFALLSVCLCACHAEDVASEAARAEKTKLFAYDAKLPLAAKEDPVQDTGAFTTQAIHFASTNGQIIPALLCRPKNVPKPPVLLYLHGLGMDKQGTRVLAAIAASKGFAVLGIDAQYHGERKLPGVEILSADLARTRQAIIQTVVDNRRALDYIHSRTDLDSDRVGLLGLSMGAILGSIVAGVDTRLCSACLVVGGGRWDVILTQSGHPVSQQLRDQGVTAEKAAQVLGDVDPVNYVGLIAPRPVQMINGKTDEIVPKAATEALFAAAQMPKQIQWLEGGHVPSVPLLLKLIAEWAQTVMTAGAQTPQQ